MSTTKKPRKGMTAEEKRDRIREIINEYNLDIMLGELDGKRFYIVSDHRDIEVLVNVFNGIPEEEWAEDGDIRKDSKSGEFLQNAIEKYGYDATEPPYSVPEDLLTMDEITNDNWGFIDEWSLTRDGQTVVRTEPDSWMWTQEYAVINNELVTYDQMDAEDIDQLIEERKNKNDRALLPFLPDKELEERGWEKFNKDRSYEIYFSVPSDMPADVKKESICVQKNKCDVLFKVTSVGQFDQEYDMWIKRKAKTPEEKQKEKRKEIRKELEEKR